ncbi:hypothetical protein [Ponticoccus litoralis]|uniref:HK97 gp10 family phage protein n=1 Tax=Ponticoccus litoralis TaxID=422297 RepID=A0AAW9SES9_9RHOB
MATIKFSQIPSWVRNAKQNANYIVRGAIEDTVDDMTNGAAGVSKGGTVQQGKVPVADSELINSFRFGIGDRGTSPQNAVANVVAGFDLGDIATAEFSAPHGPAKEYGGNGQPGWFFRQNAVAKFPGHVLSNARKFR